MVAARFWRFTPLDEDDEEAQDTFKIRFHFFGSDRVPSYLYRADPNGPSEGRRRQ
jgi:hypothetical protein